MPSYHHIVDDQPTYATLQNVVYSQDAEAFDLFCGMNAASTGDSVCMEPTMAENRPFLTIIEQPASTFRYRYKSEKGSHGGIKGENALRSKKSFPTVKVENCPQSWRKKIVIKVSLYTNELKQKPCQPHPYELTGKNSGGAKVDENFTAEFKSLTITPRKREEVLELLKARIKENHASAGKSIDEASLESKATESMKSITLDSARLCFEAFCTDNLTIPMCDKVFSNPINNQKSAATGDLKIVRLSCYAGEWSGGQDVILLCDKVKKEDIQVRFFDEEGWEGFGTFSAADIHHQVAITFKTPAYSKAIKSGTLKVWIELLRPSDQERSKALEFEYKPKDDDIKDRSNVPNVQVACQNINGSEEEVNQRKRKRLNTEDVEFDIISSAMDSPLSMDDGVFLENLVDSLEATVPGIFSDNSSGLNSWELSEDSGAFAVGQMADPYVGSDDVLFPHWPMPSKVVADGLGDISTAMDSLSLDDHFKKKLKKSKTQKASSDFMDGIKKILENRTENTYLCYATHLIPLLDEDGNSLLHLAIMEQSRNLNLVLKMLEVDASEEIINHRNNFKETPLHMAVKGNYVMILFLLLVKGGDPNVVDKDGNNCLHLAAKLGHLNCLKVLMPPAETGRTWKLKISDVDALNYDGMSALHLAVTENFEDCMNYLLSSKADVNLCEKKSGRTPLHLAIDHPLLLRGILKQPDVDVYVEDFGGITPLQLACKNHRKSFEIVSAQLGGDKTEILKFLENLSQDEGEFSESEDEECSETESDVESTDSSEFEDAVEHFSPISSSQPIAKKSNLMKTGEELREYLDRDENWKKLAILIGVDCEHVAMFDKGLSPSQTVLRKIEVRYSDLYPSDSLQTVMVNLLRVAELEEGVKILEKNS